MAGPLRMAGSAALIGLLRGTAVPRLALAWGVEGQILSATWRTSRRISHDTRPI